MAKYHKTRSHAGGTSRKSISKHVYSLAESLAREGIRHKFQDALEAERDEIVGRVRYERVASSVYRNGYHKMRCLVRGCGTVQACLTAVRPVCSLFGLSSSQAQ